MEFIGRDWEIDEDKDYTFNIRKRMLFYQAVEATPIRLMKGGEELIVGWLLRHRRLLPPPTK